MDLELKNWALLNKWLWRYVNEANNFWRKAISVIYNLEPKQLIPTDQNHKPSLLWNYITKPLNPTNKYHELVVNGFGFMLGKGDSISLWNDFWYDELPLSVKFPRIYALATDKKATIAESRT